NESSIYRSRINVGGGSTWWRCDPSFACAGQTAGLHGRYQRGQQSGRLREGICVAGSEIGQRPRWRVCRGRTRYAAHGKATAWAGCDPSLGKHGGAASLAQFSRLSGRTEARREIREVQHRRGQWLEIAVAYASWLDKPERLGKTISCTNIQSPGRPFHKIPETHSFSPN